MQHTLNLNNWINLPATVKETSFMLTPWWSWTSWAWSMAKADTANSMFFFLSNRLMDRKSSLEGMNNWSYQCIVPDLIRSTPRDKWITEIILPSDVLVMFLWDLWSSLLFTSLVPTIPCSLFFEESMERLELQGRWAKNIEICCIIAIRSPTRRYQEMERCLLLGGIRFFKLIHIDGWVQNSWFNPPCI